MLAVRDRLEAGGRMAKSTDLREGKMALFLRVSSMIMLYAAAVIDPMMDSECAGLFCLLRFPPPSVCSLKY